MAADLKLQVHHFHPADYAVFIIALLISLFIGFYYAFTGGRQKTVQEYLLGDRQMGVLPIAMSLLASFLSAIGMISVPAEIYMYGLGHSYMIIGTALALPIASSCFLPTFYNIGLTSVYEYIELRFDKHMRKIGSGLFLCQMTVYISFVLYAPALALSQVTGLHLWGSVAAVGILGTVYTSVGGIKAVMWTDVFQISIMFIALAVAAFKGALDLGGFSYVFGLASEGERLAMPSWSFDFRIRYTMWNATIGSLVLWLSVYGTNQAQVQRYLTSPTIRAAKMSLWWNVVGMAIFYILVGLAGLNIYAKYWDCDPAAGKLVSAYDQVFPLFVMETLNELPGLPGLFVAGVFCGSLSTISSAFNSMAAITLEDFVKAFDRWKNLSTEKSATVSKILAASYGCLCLLVVAAISQSDANILQSSTYNIRVFSGTVFGLFVLGMFCPWSNRPGAYAGVFLGFALSLWVSVSTQMTNKPFTPRSPYSVEGCEAMYGNKNLTFNVTTETSAAYTTTAHSIYDGPAPTESSEPEVEVFGLFQISFMWMQFLTSTVVIIIGGVTSLLTGPTKLDDLDIRLLSPVVQMLVKKYRGKKGIKPRTSSKEPTEEVEAGEVLLTPVVDGAKAEDGIHKPDPL